MAQLLLPGFLLLASRALADSSAALQACLTQAVADVAFPGSFGYETLVVQPYNLDIETSPAAVTYPTNASQVAAVAKCAADNGFPVQPKSGGHSYANHGLGGSDGAVVVNLQNFKQFSMDETTWQATFGSGMLLSELTTKLQNAGGRAISHGTCPQVGVGGHLTIGGFGPTSRQFGMSLDHIVEIEVVLANSSIVRVSADAYSDIFWALRGAAAGFGVITEFVCRTEPAPGTAVQYSYSYTFGDVETRAALFEKWQDYVTQPDLTWKLASTLTIYPSYIEISGTFFGTEAEYEALNIQNTFPGSSNASQIVFDNFLGLVGYWAEEVELQLVGGLPAHFYAKSRSFTAQSLMTSAQIRNMFTYLDNADAGTDIWFAIFDLQAGATNTVPVSATAYDARDTIFWLQSYAVNLAGDISNTTYTFLDQLNQITAAGDASPANYRAYPGYVDPRLANPQEAYWGVNLPRLEAIKAAVDPNNVFSNPQSVRPAAS